MRGFGPRTRYFAAMPLAPATGYLRTLSVLSAGGSVVLPVPGIDFCSLAVLLGVTVTSGSPTLLADLLGGVVGVVQRLPSLDYFEVMGDHLTAGLIEQARTALTPNLWINYGSTESDAVAAADAGACIEDASAAGFVVPWMTVEIVDQGDRPLPSGREGAVRVRGPTLVAGYHDNAAATGRNFRGGWFYPGDLGTRTADGMLRITGRVEDAIVRDGVSLSPVPLEEAIRGVPGVRDAAVFALEGAAGVSEISAAVVIEAGADVQAIRAGVRARLGDRGPARLFVIDSLPRSAGGKVKRRALADLARRRLAERDS
jgi:acyl-CoA synthetase (AMP-forming)/AMP-acid ligase II